MKAILLIAETSSYLDTLTGGAVILFLLSLINEKLVEFIRNHIRFPKLINPFNWLRTISIKHKVNSRFKEKQIREIRMLSIISGIIIALIAKASLFTILLSPDPQEELFWSNGKGIGNEPIDFFRFFFGILFTGFFLSFGSKFFHDLLDIFCKIKETRSQILDKPANDVPPETDQSGIYVKRALLENEHILKQKYPSLLTLETGITSSNKYGLIAYISSEIPEFPKYLDVLISGKKQRVPIEAIVNETGDVHYGINCRVNNDDYIDSKGSFGAVVIRKENPEEKLMLTCSHVVLGGKSDNLGGFTNGNYHGIEVRISGNLKLKERGSVIYAKRDDKNDVALVSLPEKYFIEWNNELPDGNIIGEPINVIEIKEGDKVSFYSSRKKETIDGILQKQQSDQPFTLKYEDGLEKEMKGLIIIGNNSSGSWSSISEKGDSGSVLFDSNFNPFGLLVGGNSSFTFAIPLVQILKDTGTEIY